MSKAIGIDVYTALHSPRGMGNYTINFLKYLAQIDKENEYILYADIEDKENILPKQENFKLILPEKRYCTDNGAMIAAEGFLQYKKRNFADLTLNARAVIPFK